VKTNDRDGDQSGRKAKDDDNDTERDECLNEVSHQRLRGKSDENNVGEGERSPSNAVHEHLLSTAAHDVVA
jgi:hypothetical protein